MISLDFTKKLKAQDGDLDLKIQCTIEPGTLVTLYGESGVGKTSTLRILAGLMNPDEGQISVDGQTWFHKANKINISPQRRKVGFVFQDFALFPNMTVQKNLEFALHNPDDNRLIDELLEVMQLQQFRDRHTDTLSGGQKQRVAIARALAQKPKILLLDEPLAALDANIRRTLQDYLLLVHREFNLTTLLISHDIGEIHKVSDLVFKMEKGTIVEKGTPGEIFVDQKVSGKFRFTGEVLAIDQQEVVFIVTVLIQNTVVKVIAQKSEVKELRIGDTVMVVSKAFNPIIQKVV